MNQWGQKTILAVILLVYGYLIIQPINLTAVDLGRHIKNGQLILEGNYQVLYQNVYSFTFPNYSFVNHHWLSGVIFYLINQLGGFNGLSLFFGLTSILTLWLFLSISFKKSDFYITLLTSLSFSPLLIYRTEIRPEIFSYLFLGILFWILNQSLKKLIFLIPLIMFFWINLHLYFVFGFALLGIFWLESFIRWRLTKDQPIFSNLKKLTGVICASLLASLINPSGWKGILHPLTIYGNYGYKVLEEQSVSFLDGGFPVPVLIYFKLALGLLIFSWIIWAGQAYKKQTPLKKLIEENLVSRFLLSILFSYLGWIMLRNFTISALFFLPIVAINLKDVLSQYQKNPNLKYLTLPVAACLIIFLLVLSPQYWENRSQAAGLYPGVENSANFFKQNNLKGPIFNNYDIGSFLIYELYPQEKVFVDNRPEVYPADFFQNTYIPSQEDDQKWKTLDKQYSFNVIFFYRLDLTPWAQKFLITRTKDPEWAPVYVDDFSIILVKRNGQNNQIVKKFEIPKERFLLGS